MPENDLFTDFFCAFVFSMKLDKQILMPQRHEDKKLKILAV